MSLLCDRTRPGPQWKRGRSLLRPQTQTSLWLQPLPPPTSPLSTHTHPAWPGGNSPRAANTRAHTHTHFLSWWPWWLAHQFVRHVCFRMLGDSVIPLPHIYGARMKGVEIFCPLDPPPPYEAVAGSSTNAVTRVEFLLAFHWLIDPLLMDFWGWYWVIEFCQKHSRVHLLHTFWAFQSPAENCGFALLSFKYSCILSLMWILAIKIFDDLIKENWI